MSVMRVSSGSAPKRRKGGIHINPANKGKLRAALGVSGDKNIPTSKLDAAANSSNPTLKKRAVFAKNARNWHH